MSRAPDHQLAAAWQALASGDRERSEALFSALIANYPQDPLVLTGAANLLRQHGRLRDAALHCDAALRADPDCLEAWLERGYVMNTGGSFAAASNCYREVLGRDPDHAAAHAALAALAVRDGDHAACEHHAKQALATEPDNFIAAAALAASRIEQGHPAAARDLLLPLVDRLDPPGAETIQLLTTLGEAHGLLGEADAAHAAFARAQDQFRSLHEAGVPPRETNRALIERVTTELAEISPERWSDPVAPSVRDDPRHVFLLGFPRSGTTLVENVLASLPGVAALEERPTLVDADRAFLANPGGLTQLSQLSPDALAPYVEAYWAKVRGAGIDPACRTFIDMDPLKASRLPVIARLFPQARILIMRRDPRDVVWSCFRTNFALTSAALEFTSLERTARHYAAMMTLIETARERLPLAFHEVDYHALVRDFDGETRRLCTFLGLPWDESLRRFDRTAQQRGVATASATQVRRGLYDGRGQWQPYAKYFEPVMPLLQPWIERFGYA